MRPTLYEFAGGDAAFVALATAHHARCLQDPELNHPFSHPDQHPQGTSGVSAGWLSVARVAATVKFALLVPAVIVGVGAAVDGLVRLGRSPGSGAVVSPDA